MNLKDSGITSLVVLTLILFALVVILHTGRIFSERTVIAPSEGFTTSQIKLERALEVNWGATPPRGFDEKTALQKVQRYISAYPGFRYGSLLVMMKDVQVSPRVTEWPSVVKAREKGAFIIDLWVYAKIDVGEKDLSQCNNSDSSKKKFFCDRYTFTLAFFPLTNEYEILGKGMQLKDVPPGVGKIAAEIVGISRTSMSRVDMHWVKRESGYWHEGLPDGVIYIFIPDQGTLSNRLPIEREVYVDVFQGTILEDRSEEVRI